MTDSQASYPPCFPYDRKLIRNVWGLALESYPFQIELSEKQTRLFQRWFVPIIKQNHFPQKGLRIRIHYWSCAFVAPFLFTSIALLYYHHGSIFRNLTMTYKDYGNRIYVEFWPVADARGISLKAFMEYRRIHEGFGPPLNKKDANG